MIIDKNCGKDIGIFHVEYALDERANDGHLKYHVICKECGQYFDRKLSGIKSTKKCTHSTNKWKVNQIRIAYWEMHRRCYNPSNKDYKYYGGKGVRICKDWYENPTHFEDWALKNGYKDNLSIDRVDSTKDYTPENCRWIPTKENCRRAGKVNWITIGGDTLTGRQWAEKLGLGVNTINRMIRKNGMSQTIEYVKSLI